MYRFIPSPSLSNVEPPDVPFLVGELIPGFGNTFLHGPPGAGKSAFLWEMANCLESGTHFLDLPVEKARVLLVSLDMNEIELKVRWFGTKRRPKDEAHRFNPKFDIIVSSPFDVCSKTSPSTDQFVSNVKEVLKATKYGLVIVDALGRFTFDDLNMPNTVAKVHAACAEIFGDTPYLLNHHDRKHRMVNGEPAALTAEDALGSQMWRAYATAEVHLWKANDTLRKMKLAKSQVGVDNQEVWDLWIDLSGRIELYQEHRAQEVIKRLEEGLAGLPTGLSQREQDKALAQLYNVTDRTVRSWRALKKDALSTASNKS